MKKVLIALAVILGTASVSEAQWTPQQQMYWMAQQQQAYRRAQLQRQAEILNARHRMPPRMGNQTVYRDYYRGPGGDIRTKDQIPAGTSLNGNYRYMGSFGPGHTYQGR